LAGVLSKPNGSTAEVSQRLRCNFYFNIEVNPEKNGNVEKDQEG
jgi:hypothetical protein